ncbi:DUF663-domain-containing protein [Nadsonia fulvescens var. elongata DSM 6958]|uniref:DUF663-domain-containing protein n=1 Tax=Nadsonia fulvescens var. elongata DSM 6958 TaxID=857566 RepID=A0A1E3PPR3_9ASCO|nr:DUF663-domain-containing protein [Nadsonia fulvescens var. elongata DSM 6958]
MDGGDQSNKSHRVTKDKNSTKKKLHVNGYNAKAFAVAAPGKMERQARRTHDLNEKKYHVPMVDRTPEEAPPIIVAVVGPPGTGKSTLIKSLIRRYTKHSVSEIKGPITVVSGKRRRLTFIECSNDLNSMIDLAKIADLILMMVDGNFGLEMETMEFLNILAPHGFPRILGVTTHLDLFKSPATLRLSKKRLKQRFWTEVYQGAKLFYLSGVINGRYPDREILNLARFISVMKFRPLKWRNEHPYLLADRVVDITHPNLIEENPKVDRKVTLYGYLHGTPLPYANARVHVPGIGDLNVKEVERLPDPCATPYAQKIEEQNSTGPKRRKRLDDKMKTIYAPMSDVGGVLVDKDAVYIDVGSRSFVPGEERGIGERMVTSLQTSKTSLGETNENTAGLRLFTASDDDEAQKNNKGRTSLRSARAINTLEDEEDLVANPDDDEDDDNEEFEPNYEVVDFEQKYNKSKLVRNKGKRDELIYADSDSDFGDIDNEDDEENVNIDGTSGALRWKENLAGNALKNFQTRKRRWDISKLIYMDNINPTDAILRWKGEEEDEYEEEDIEAESDDDDFFKKRSSSRPDDIAQDFDDDMAQPIFDSRFMTAPAGLKNAKNGGGEDDDEEVFGGFEDLETGETFGDEGEEDLENGSDDEDHVQNEKESEDEEHLTVEEIRAKNAAKKEKLRLQFEQEEGEDRDFGAEDPEGDHDTWHDAQKAKISKQLEINKAEFETMDDSTRDRIEGFRAGSYVRLVFEKIPCEFIENFDPTFPVLVGGLLSNEDKFGFTQVRIKRHRWHKRILKSNDPLVLSLGWRRFQTIPIYSTSDSRTRNRMLKYTPEHMHCFATFYGPLVSPNTGFCAVQSVSNDQATGAFRIAATGTVLEVDQSVEIVKKLKLVGYPYKVYKNTAFIKDMFTSALEVAKFEGAQIKTVSGIRGQIKRALSKPEGHFRATFEDKILLSDIVFLRAWFPIQARKFYNPVTSLLLQDKANWHGMKLTGQVRAERALNTPSVENSRYGKIERQVRHFHALKVPKSIKADLPFKSQIAQMKPQNKKTYMQKRAVVLGGEEKKARELMQKVMTIRNEKEAKRKEKKGERMTTHLKKVAKNDAIRKEKDKERRKEYFQKEGKKRAPEEKTGRFAKKSKNDD